jgi:hypothetical protein
VLAEEASGRGSAGDSPDAESGASSEETATAGEPSFAQASQPKA